ncbi:hypothetical protein Tco_1307482 [Tanacetum coccineum]
MKRMSKRQRELPTSTRRRLKRHIREVVSADDNGEDVTKPRASKRNKKGTLLPNYLPVIRKDAKEIQLACWEERFQYAKDKNTRPQRSFGLFKSSREATSLFSLGEWLESR